MDQPGEFHVALQPRESSLEKESECQMINMIPVLDVTGLGITDPEYASSKMAVYAPVSKQSIVAQPRIVSVSAPCSVLKAEKASVTDDAPVGAMIPVISSNAS